MKKIILTALIILLLTMTGSYEAVIAADLKDNGNGTVTDKSTGLMWQQKDYGETAATREDVSLYCKKLELAGYKDWRLPTCEELLSIVDTTKSNPAINIIYFPDTKATYYWASDIWGYFGSNPMFCIVDFKTGKSEGVYETNHPISGDGRSKCGRCVRAVKKLK